MVYYILFGSLSPLFLNLFWSYVHLVWQASKPQLRRWIDRVGEVYSKAVIGATLAALVILPLRGVPMLSTATQRGALYRC